MSISFGGLASGLDTQSIISQLMAIEQGRANARRPPPRVR